VRDDDVSEGHQGKSGDLGNFKIKESEEWAKKESNRSKFSSIHFNEHSLKSHFKVNRAQTALSQIKIKNKFY